MPKIHRKILGGRSYCNYNQVYLENALNEIRKGRLSIRQASEMFAVPRTTLQDKIKKNHTGKIGRPCVLSVEEEDALVHGLTQCALWGFPLTPKDLRLLVKNYLDRDRKGRNVSIFKENLPGEDWVRGFLRRHENLSCRLSENIKRSKASVGIAEINEYFYNLEKSLEHIPPENIVNYDETNFVDDPGKVKVIVKKGTKHPERITDTSKSGVSVMMAGTAAGELLPPYVLYRAKHLYPGWTEGGISGSHYNRNDSGWFDLDIFEDWFLKICLPYLRKLSGKKIIIGDNLSSHLSLEVIKLCESNDIGFVLLPANTTHLTQPLDIALFRPIKIAWRKTLDEWKNKNRGSLPKTEFPRILKRTIELIGVDKIRKNVKSGFLSAGIYPLNKEAVLRKLPESQKNESLDQSWSDSFTDLLKTARLGEKKNTTKPKGKRMNVKAGKSICVADVTRSEIEPQETASISNEMDTSTYIQDACSFTGTEVCSACPSYEIGDFVLVQFLSDFGKSQRFYAAEILEASDIYVIKCLRKKSVKNVFFVFPDVEDVSSVGKDQIVTKLELQLPVRRGRHFFKNIKDSLDIF